MELYSISDLSGFTWLLWYKW